MLGLIVQDLDPADVAAQILHGVRNGVPEILADEPTRNVKQSLAAILGPA